MPLWIWVLLLTVLSMTIYVAVVHYRGGVPDWDKLKELGFYALVIIVAMFSLSLFFGGDDSDGVRPAQVATQSLAPRAIQPQFTSASVCDGTNTVRIPTDSVAQKAVFRRDSRGYVLLWTGEEDFNILQPIYPSLWVPGVDSVLLQVEYMRGHIDDSNLWNPQNGEHVEGRVDRSRGYGTSRGSYNYCPLTNRYPRFSILSRYWGPGQVAVILDPTDPRKGLYPFSDGPVSVVVRRGEHPILSHNNHYPPNGRWHQATFGVVATFF